MVKQLYDWSRQETPGKAKKGFMDDYGYTFAVLQMPPITFFIAISFVASLLAVSECLSVQRYFSIVFVMIMSTIQNLEVAWPAITANSTLSADLGALLEGALAPSRPVAWCFGVLAVPRVAP